jgi:Sulfatase
MNVKTVVQGFGAAIVVLILRVWPHLSRYHPVIYHSFLPMQSVVWGVLIDLAVISLSAALLFAWLEKNEKSLRTVIWALVGAEVASAAVVAASAMHHAPIPLLTPRAAYFLTLIPALLLRWVRPSWYLQAVRGFGVLLALIGCSMVWMVPQLLYQGLRTQRADAAVPVVQTSPQTESAGKRIVWLLFDELSYDQTFEHRYPGLDMPAFDTFKRQSVVFSDLRPAGYYTDRVIPSLLVGARVDNIRSSLDGEPIVNFTGHPWQRFDPQTTLFADAQKLGWTTGVVGWYNPYCRILAGTMNYCFWQMGDGQSDGALPQHSAFRNAAAPVEATILALRGKPGLAIDKHLEDMAVLMPQAKALLRDESISFVFIHLPVPHPPGIYDRRPGHTRRTGSYIDNLALADKTLAELMDTLQATTLAPKTTIIVCSDHSWRVPLWRATPSWTKEDEAASHGRFDPRPVLMIHKPDQQTEQDVTTSFDEIRIHDILGHLLRGEDTTF